MDIVVLHWGLSRFRLDSFSVDQVKDSFENLADLRSPSRWELSGISENLV